MDSQPVSQPGKRKKGKVVPNTERVNIYIPSLPIPSMSICITKRKRHRNMHTNTCIQMHAYIHAYGQAVTQADAERQAGRSSDKER